MAFLPRANIKFHFTYKIKNTFACDEFGSVNFQSVIIFKKAILNVKTLPLSSKNNLSRCFVVLTPFNTKSYKSSFSSSLKRNYRILSGYRD